jgi:hypothetical protein
MPASFLVASAFLIAISTLGLAVGAVYLGGGAAAVRRQLPQLTLLAALIVVVAVAAPVLTQIGGSAFVIALVVLNVVAVLMWVGHRRKAASHTSLTSRRNAWQMPGFRWLVIAYIVVVAVGSITIAIATRPAQ